MNTERELTEQEKQWNILVAESHVLKHMIRRVLENGGLNNANSQNVTN